MLGVIVCTLDKSFSISDTVSDGPKKETVGWFGFCQRFESDDDRQKFIDYIKLEGYIDESELN